MSASFHDPAETERLVEALLFAAAGPLSLADLEQRLPEGADVMVALEALAARYSGRGVVLAPKPPMITGGRGDWTGLGSAGDSFTV